MERGGGGVRERRDGKLNSLLAFEKEERKRKEGGGGEDLNAGWDEVLRTTYCIHPVCARRGLKIHQPQIAVATAWPVQFGKNRVARVSTFELPFDDGTWATLCAKAE